MTNIVSINRSLQPSERIVYRRNGGFNYSGASIVGTKSFVFTNLGRALIHDTGGFFGTETAHHKEVTNGGIIVQDYNTYGLSIKSNSEYPFSFSFDVPLDDFENLLQSMPASCFHFRDVKDLEFPIYLLEANNTIHASYITLNKNGIIISLYSKKHFISFNYIRKLTKINDYKVRLDGFFYLFGIETQSFTIFIPIPNKAEKILEICQSVPKLGAWSKNISKIFHIKYADMSGSEVDRVLILDDKGTLEVIEEETGAIVDNVTLKDDNWFYQTSKSYYFVLRPLPIKIKFTTPEAANYASMHFQHHHNVVAEELGQLTGIYDNEVWEQCPVHILIRNHSEMILIDKLSGSCISMSESKSITYVHAGPILFIDGEEELSMVKWPDDSWTRYFNDHNVKPIQGYNLGYTATEQPYRLQFNENKIELLQKGVEISKTFHTEHITDIQIESKALNNDFMSVVAIHVKGEVEPTKLTLVHSLIPQFIQFTYLSNKQSLVSQVKPEQLYLSWARQTHDHIMYHMYGELYAFGAGVNEILDAQETQDSKNIRLLNFIYYTIAQQRRKLDQVAIYLPGLLEETTKKNLGAEKSPLVEDIFIQMQQILIGVSHKVKQQLSELDSALAPIHRLVIPRPDLEKLIDKRHKRGHVQTAGLSALAVGSSLLLSPVLLLPFGVSALFSGLNNYANMKESYEKLNMEAKYDKELIRINMERAIDHYHHMMTTMMPYFIAETNRLMQQCFERLAVVYRDAMENPEVGRRMVEEMSHMYTFKQLPIDDSVLTTRKALVDNIYDSVSLTKQHISLFQYEVIEHVRK